MRHPENDESTWDTWPGTERATEALTLAWPPCDARCDGVPHDPDLRLVLVDLEVERTPARGGDWWDIRRKTELERTRERLAVRPATSATQPESRLPRLTRVRRIASTDGTWGAFSRYEHQLVIEDLFEILDGPFGGGQLVAVQRGPGDGSAWLAGRLIVLDHPPSRDPAVTAQGRADFLRDNHARFDRAVWQREAASTRVRAASRPEYLPGELHIGAMPGLEDARVGDAIVLADLGFIPHEISLATAGEHTVLAQGPHDPLRPTWTVRIASGVRALEIVDVTAAEAGAPYGRRGPEVAAFLRRLRRLDPERCGALALTESDWEAVHRADRTFDRPGRFPPDGPGRTTLGYFEKSAVGRAIDDSREVLGRAFSDVHGDGSASRRGLSGSSWTLTSLLAGIVAGEIAGGPATLDRNLRRRATMLREMVDACPPFGGPDPDYPTLEHAGVRELSAIAFSAIGRPLLMNHEGLEHDRQIGGPIVDLQGGGGDVWVHAGQPVWADNEQEHASHPTRANELGCFRLTRLQPRAGQPGTSGTEILRGFHYVALLTALDDDPILHDSDRAAATVAAIEARVRSDPRRARLW